MRIAKNDIPVRINAPGAVARQKTNFGDATGYGTISGEYFSLGLADLQVIGNGSNNSFNPKPPRGSA